MKRWIAVATSAAKPVVRPKAARATDRIRWWNDACPSGRPRCTEVVVSHPDYFAMSPPMARLATVLLVLLVACDLPRDPDDTLDRIRRDHVARIGIADAPPWTSVAGGTPTGVEPTLVAEMLR